MVEPENSAPSAERNPSAADMANKEMVQKPETFNTDQLRYSAPRAELNRTSQEHPVENREMKGVELTDRSREIIDKISIPSGMAPSEPQNLLRAGGELKPTDLNLVTGEARAKEDRQHLKARHFLTLSLEDLNDQNSTWLPVEGYRIYLSAQHRYRGLREVTDIFPLWIYEGELPPEFLDQKKAWKFYDRLPKSYTSLEATPAPVAKYILEMKGAQAEEVKTTAAKPEGKAVAPEANTEAKYLAGSERDGQIASPTPSAPTHSALERIFSAIKAMLGISG